MGVAVHWCIRGVSVAICRLDLNGAAACPMEPLLTHCLGVGATDSSPFFMTACDGL
jgi:hypothetical protein